MQEHIAISFRTTKAGEAGWVRLDFEEWRKWEAAEREKS